MFIINAEALMNMAHKRLCSKASLETRKLMGMIKHEIEVVDPALARHLVPMCVYRGGICSEPNSCGYTDQGKGYEELMEFKLNNDKKCKS